VSTATQPVASDLPLWIVTVRHDGRPLAHTVQAASPVQAIAKLAALLALPVEAFTEVHVVRA
jgi:hypothetical protein